MMNRLRMPTGAYVPPIPEQLDKPPVPRASPLQASQQIVTPAGPYEADSAVILCRDITNPSTAQPLKVFETSRRWKGIDVYISTDFVAALNTQWLSIGIFAIVRETRTLVATGRTRITSGTIRVASARVQADKFEVVIGKTASALDPANMTARLSYVATDEVLPEPNKYDGTVPPAAGGDEHLRIEAFQGTPGLGLIPTLVMATGVNGSGAVRWYQIFGGDTVPIAGDRPMYSLFCGINESFFLEADALSALQVARNVGFFAGPSTTAITYTAPGAFDFGHRLLFR